MDLLNELTDLFLKLPEQLARWEGQLGVWIYLVVFAIVFCETGLVVTPFLPGDSLLFALGTRAADPKSPLEFWTLFFLIACAAVLGDAVNYAVGYYLGPKVFSREDSRFLNKKHLMRTHAFYEKHGGKTIVLARFVPIVRTFAPFVAGIGRMGYLQFAVYNVAGGALWVVICLAAGYYFGSQPWVQKNFSLVVLGIIFVSILPIVIEAYLQRRRIAAVVAEGASTETQTPVKHG